MLRFPLLFLPLWERLVRNVSLLRRDYCHGSGRAHVHEKPTKMAPNPDWLANGSVTPALLPYVVKRLHIS